MDKKILVSKNNDSITIVNQGKRLIVEDNDFEKIKNLSKEEIIKWYLDRK